MHCSLKVLASSAGVFAAGVLYLGCVAVSAQQANINLEINPLKNTENLIPFGATINSPEVRDDKTVIFRLKAPDVHSVSLTGVAILTSLKSSGKPIPFTKGDNGVWTLTVGPMQPDMYQYYLLIDGVQVADPNNSMAGFTAMPPYSTLIVPGDGPAYYDARDVPHGLVTRHVYHSTVTDGERELYVYTPPGYDRHQKYPVLYLVGGSGDLPSNWIYDGRVNFMMDNLLAEHKVVPMVIAIPNNQVVHRASPRHTELTFKIFNDEMRKSVIPLVESQYSVRTDPHGRAMSGLSMGGRHTMFVGLNSLDLFRSFGVLSAGDEDSETTMASFLNDPTDNQKIDYLFLGQGTIEAQGRMNGRVAAFEASLKKHNIKHEFYEGGYAAHDWATWRHLMYYRFLPNLWRTPASANPPAMAAATKVAVKK